MIGFRRRSEQVYTTVRRSAQHYMSAHDGIETSHSFSAGADYEADNVAFGALVGLDEHRVDVGAGFAPHRHRGVTTISWVLDGVLRHRDEHGRDELIRPGELAVQVSGTGVEHSEWNGGDQRLRFLQLTLNSGLDEPSYARAGLPLRVADTYLDVHRNGRLILEARRMLLHVVSGEYMAGKIGLYVGDQLRGVDEPIMVEGQGELLVVLLR